MGAEARLAELKLELPPAPKPVATYVTAVRYGDLLYVSGHGPLRPDGTLHVGRLGDDLDVPAGHAAARQTGLAILATVRSHATGLAAGSGLGVRCWWSARARRPAWRTSATIRSDVARSMARR